MGKLPQLFQRQPIDIVSNVKQKKIMTYIKKTKERRVATFSGCIAKLQQSYDNGEPFFVYYLTKKTTEFLKLLREQGIIHNFSILSSASVWNDFSISLSPDFNSRLAVVHLNLSSKQGPILSQFKTFTIPSRAISITYAQLRTKVKHSRSTLYVLNTSQGLLTHMAALYKKIGGEVVCAIQ